MGVSGSMIGQYETEARRPNFKTATAVASALNIDEKNLMVEFEADDLQAISVAAISRSEMELLCDQERIMHTAPLSIRKAQNALLQKVDEICKSAVPLDEAQQLHEISLMPERICLVTEFIERNADFLRKNMPGLIDNAK
jgi:transcriptional regulator with XRE-family HTH domain